MNCPIEGEVTIDECVACYGSMKHVPCPLDLDNPTFAEECLGTTVEALREEHPEWLEAL